MTEFWLSQMRLRKQPGYYPDTAKKNLKRNSCSSRKRQICRAHRKPDSSSVKVGDVVMYAYGGTEINIEGTDYLIMRASDILESELINQII